MITKFTKHLLSVLMFFVALTATAADFIGAAPENGKSYYLYNVGTGLFLGEGDNWGTHASVHDMGSDVKLTTNNTGFTINTHFGSKYLSWADNGLWMDQSTKTQWNFALVEGTTNRYTIQREGLTTYFQCTAGQTKVNLAAMPENAELAQWILVPVSELEARRETASYSNPVDITYLIANPRFDVSYADAFTWDGGVTVDGYRGDTPGTAGGNYVAYFKEKTFDSFMEISAGKGLYKLCAQGCNYSQNGVTSLDAELYLGGKSFVVLPDAMDGTAQDGQLATMAKAIADGGYVTEGQMAIIQTSTLKIGFRKETKQMGDISIYDNLRLYYYGNTLEDYQAFILDQKAEAESLLSGRMTADALSALQTAAADYTDSDVSSTAKCSLLSGKIADAISVAKRSIKIYGKLKAAIDEANEFASNATGNGVDELKAAVAEAQAIYDNAESTEDVAKQTIVELQRAITDYRFANASGTAPKVVTDTRFARGGTMAFLRMTVSGSSIAERGVCFATHPNPTYSDFRSTATLDNGGTIYWVKGLEPGTIYYMRAYALTSNYAIGYGDVIKVITIPKGSIGYGIYGFSGDDYNRVAASAERAAQVWSDLTSISGYWSSINYGSGTPTADCSYGGWMRIGPSASYQQTGTILHEWLHGVGVGTHWTWSSGDLRSGNWLGERANAVLQFWDNKSDNYMTGDGMHMWPTNGNNPYGVNGAHEDYGTDVQYFGNALIIQGLCEDGLIPTGGFCLPAYTLPVDNDDKKYYIKSESKNHGLDDSYLFVESDGSLKWKQATPETVTDDAAWTITFTPNNAYYQFKNVGTGRYLTYSNNKFTTAARTSATSADNFHVMKGRVDVSDIKGLRGYWLINPNNTEQPPTMTAAANGAVTSSSFNLGNSAVTQRWVIRTMEEVDEMANELLQLAKDDLEIAIANVRGLLNTPHTDIIEGATATLTTILDNIEAQIPSCTKAEEVRAFITEVNDAEFDFLTGVVANDESNPFDLTYKIISPRMNVTDGWDKANGGNPGIDFSAAEYYERTFDFNQTIAGLPRGEYIMTVQAFQRPGSASTAYSNYNSGNKTVTTSVYAGATTQFVMNAIDGASATKLGGNESTVGSKYIPNNMEAASKYFAKGLYENKVETVLAETTNSLKIGIKCTSTSSAYWTIFDDWHLYSMGNTDRVDAEFLENNLDELEKVIANVRPHLSVPHDDVIGGATTALTTLLDNVEAQAPACTKADEVLDLIEQVKEAEILFLESVVATDDTKLFDLTYRIVNPRMTVADGWTTTADVNAFNFSCAEYYVRTFDFYQTITGLPRGKYQMTVQAFQRPGEASAVYTNYNNGNKTVTTSVYAGATVQPVMHVMDGASSTQLGGAESTVGSKYIPNNMEAASKYFAKGLYENKVTTELTGAKNNLKIGLKCTDAPDYYWTIFDDFHLYSFGNESGITGIDGVQSEADVVRTEYFSLGGTQLAAPQKGVNILRTTYSDGKVEVRKVMVK